jgi:hypothetical protein
MGLRWFAAEGLIWLSWSFFAGSVADVLLCSGCTPKHPFVNAPSLRAVAWAKRPDTEFSLCEHPAGEVRPNQDNVIP